MPSVNEGFQDGRSHALLLAAAWQAGSASRRGGCLLARPAPGRLWPTQRTAPGLASSFSDNDGAGPLRCWRAGCGRFGGFFSPASILSPRTRGLRPLTASSHSRASRQCPGERQRPDRHRGLVRLRRGNSWRQAPSAPRALRQALKSHSLLLRRRLQRAWASRPHRGLRPLPAKAPRLCSACLAVSVCRPRRLFCRSRAGRAKLRCPRELLCRSGAGCSWKMAALSARMAPALPSRARLSALAGRDQL